MTIADDRDGGYRSTILSGRIPLDGAGDARPRRQPSDGVADPSPIEPGAVDGGDQQP